MATTCTYSGLLSGPVLMGQMFIISGRATRSARRVDFNLAEDKNHREIPLHVSCRFQENLIVRTNKANNNYGTEDRTPGKNNQKNPLKAGEDFNCVILVGQDRFHIAFNNKDYCDFLFRMPLNRIKVLQVLQDVEYIRRADHLTAYPMPYPPPYMRDNVFSFSNDVPARLTKGHVMVFHATALGNASGNFSVHFLNGQAPKTAIVFNFALPPKNLVTRCFINAKNEFQHQETFGPPMTIATQRPFKIAFGFGDQGWMVALNGQQLWSYKYQNPMAAYSGIKCTEHEGLILNILAVDHIQTQDVQLRNFEQYSRL